VRLQTTVRKSISATTELQDHQVLEFLVSPFFPYNGFAFDLSGRIITRSWSERV